MKIRTLRNLLKNYFWFTSSQLKGLILLILINFLLLSLLLNKNINSEKTVYNNNAFQKEVFDFYASLRPVFNKNLYNRLDRYIIARYDTLKLFPFDPNTATDEQFRRLGLTEKQIRNIREYQQRGGRFITKDDFKKVYSIRTRQYLILKPYILLPDRKSHVSVPKLFYFDPNTVSEKQLQQLGFTKKQAAAIIRLRNKGWKFYNAADFAKLNFVSDEMFTKLKPYIRIDKSKLIPELNSANFYDIFYLVKDKKIASVIKKYRDRLGGFYSFDQLKEIKVLTPELLKLLQDSVRINPLIIKKIHINTAERKMLGRHPYIGWKKADMIIKNRPFSSIDDLLNKKIFTPEQFNKLKPYLTL